MGKHLDDDDDHLHPIIHDQKIISILWLSLICWCKYNNNRSHQLCQSDLAIA